jgi:hypothetical protein
MPTETSKPIPHVQTLLASSRLQGVLRGLIVSLSAFFLLLFLYTALRRMRYPFDLEWVESGVLVSVYRLAHHQPLYAAPTLDYVPYLYAPLYFYVCAFVAKWTGVSFFTLRLVSTMSALGTLAVLFAFVYRETRSAFSSITAVGLFTSMYAVIGAWFDIGRVDSLFILLFTLALYSTRFAPPVVAAAAWVLAFQTKQSAIALAIPFLTTYWDRQRKSRMIIALASYIVLSWASIHLFDHLNGGWYDFYVFGATTGLPSVMRLAALYIPEVILAPLAIAVVIIAAALVVDPPSLNSRAARFYLMGSATTFFGFWWVHAHRGVGNTMQALYLWIAILLGVALHRLLTTFCPRQPGFVSAYQTPASARSRNATTILLLAVLVQLASQIYNPGQFLPSKAERSARELMIAQIRDVPGTVYVVNHSYDSILAGKQPQAEAEAIGAIIDAFPGRWRNALTDEMRTGSAQHRWSALVVDDSLPAYRWIGPDSLASYPVKIPAEGSNLAHFLTSQPHFLLLPCSATADGIAQRIVSEGEVVNSRACAAAAASPPAP